MNSRSRIRPTRIHSSSMLRLWLQRSPGVFLPALFGAIVVTVLLTASAQAQTRYKIIRIPTPDGFNSTALGINDSGNVVGYSYQGDVSQAFLYSYSRGTI